MFINNMLWVLKDVKIHHLEKLAIIPTGDMRKKTHKNRRTREMKVQIIASKMTQIGEFLPEVIWKYFPSMSILSTKCSL